MTDLAKTASAAFPTSQEGMSLEKEELLAHVVAEYRTHCRGGNHPDVAALISQYPEIAAELTACLASIDFLENIAEQERLLTRPLAGEKDSNEDGNGASLGRVEGTLGDYRVRGEIGRGGMGIVYEALQISLGRRVALKVLPFAAILDERAKKRFQNEALAAAQLDHPHIVDVYGVGCERGVHYYAMRLIEGRSLADIIQHLREQIAANPHYCPSTLADLVHPARPATSVSSTSDLPSTSQVPSPQSAETVRASATRKSHPDLGRDYYRAIATLGMHVAEALDHAHEQGVLHRDIKPSNLMLDSSGKVWITDFGLARIDSAASLTHTGDLLGTLRYMSPEQALGKRVLIDHRSDIYSLGATLFELLTLQPAFMGGNRGELLRQIASDEPTAPRKFVPKLPADLETIILKAMEKDPRSRFDSASELSEDLGRYLEKRAIHAHRPGVLTFVSRWGQRHRELVTAIFAVFVLATIGLAAATWRINLLKNQAADTAAREREQRLRAAKNFERAMSAIQELVGTFGTSVQKDNGLQRKVIEKAIALIKNYLDEPASDASGKRQHALAYLSLSTAYSTADRSEEALAASNSAIMILNDLQRTFPKDLDYQHDLGNAYRQRAVHNSIADVSKAKQDLEASIQHLREVQAVLPLDAEVAFHLGISHVYLANLLRSQPNPNLNAADVERHIGLELLNNAILRDPTNLPYQDFLNLWSRQLTKELLPGESLNSEVAQVFFLEQIGVRNWQLRGGQTSNDKWFTNDNWAATFPIVLSVLESSDLSEDFMDDANELAWTLVTYPFTGGPDPRHAISLALVTTRKKPWEGRYWKTLGVAYYRAGNWRGCIENLNLAIELSSNCDSADRLFLSMAHYKIGEIEKAMRNYDYAAEYIDTFAPHDEELIRFRTEAAALLCKSPLSRQATTIPRQARTDNTEIGTLGE